MGITCPHRVTVRIPQRPQPDRRTGQGGGKAVLSGPPAVFMLKNARETHPLDGRKHKISRLRRMGAKLWLIRRVASWRLCLGQQHNWPDVAPSQRPRPRADRASPHLQPHSPSCQTPTPHWHLHPRGHLGLAQQGPFSPENTEREKEGKGD